MVFSHLNGTGREPRCCILLIVFCRGISATNGALCSVCLCKFSNVRLCKLRHRDGTFEFNVFDKLR